MSKADTNGTGPKEVMVIRIVQENEIFWNGKCWKSQCGEGLEL